jgi:ABC-type bacteriocin/lantibiotic exporter with double-glycine peptidase domain
VSFHFSLLRESYLIFSLLALVLLREKIGITCKVCGGCAHYWLKSKEMYQCKLNSCRFRTSLKSGTVMENSKLSFHIWYKAMHLITATKNNISAVEVQRQLGIKNYEFIKSWIGNDAKESTEEGIALLLEPTPKLKEKETDDEEVRKGFSFLYQYLFRYKRFLFQLVLGLVTGSLLQLAFPFLTQSIVDVGVQNQDISFIYLILLAQLLLFAGR